MITKLHEKEGQLLQLVDYTDLEKPVNVLQVWVVGLVRGELYMLRTRKNIGRVTEIKYLQFIEDVEKEKIVLMNRGDGVYEIRNVDGSCVRSQMDLIPVMDTPVPKTVEDFYGPLEILLESMQHMFNATIRENVRLVNENRALVTTIENLQKQVVSAKSANTELLIFHHHHHTGKTPNDPGQKLAVEAETVVPPPSTAGPANSDLQPDRPAGADAQADHSSPKV